MMRWFSKKLTEEDLSLKLQIEKEIVEQCSDKIKDCDNITKEELRQFQVFLLSLKQKNF